LDADGENLVLKRYFHVGIAVDTPNGLLVPVIRDCDKKSLQQIAQELEAVSRKAREKGLPMADMAGGCFTISSLGGIGGTAFTPIINAPEVAVLGVSRTREVATRAADGSLEWRMMMPLDLSYDHRVINGADAARFCRAVAGELAGPAGPAR
jgi:pyruvate dehydrogenase E2 component (dihydrolipoamide acetyltransferase)